MGSVPNPAVSDASSLLPRTWVAPDASFSLLARWHLLSLDAPTVATVWMWFVARCFSFALSGYELAGMFLAVWILYATDRLLDSRTAGHPVPDLKPRHHFHAVHRKAFLVGLGGTFAGLFLCVAHFPLHELALEIRLGGLLAAWFLLIHSVGRLHRLRLPKEIAVGVFFAAAVFLPAAAHRPQSAASMIPPALLFAGLCSANGLFIHVWESDRAPDTTASTSQIVIWLVHRIQPLALLGCATAAVLALVLPGPDAPLDVAVAVSLLLLLLLHSTRSRLQATHLRALADLVLLSPLLVAVLLA